MKNEKTKKVCETNGVCVDVHTLYQLLLSDCRYGYTRNNHLMPWGAFEHCRVLLPQMLEANPETAIHTARQLAEEAIGQLWSDSFRDEEKQFMVEMTGPGGSREEIWTKWSPGTYQYDAFKTFKAEAGLTFTDEHGNKLLSTEECEDDPGMIRVIYPEFDITKSFSKDRLWARMYKQIEVRPSKEGTAHYDSVLPYDNKVEKGRAMAFVAERAEKDFDVRLCEDFIDFCLGFLEENDAQKPYNYESYEKYLSEHPKP